MAEEIIDIEAPERKYNKFYRQNGIPYAYVLLDADDYLDTEVPASAKWAVAEYDDEGEPLVLKTLSHFAPHANYIESSDEYLVLLCAVERPSIRHKAVTECDLDEWKVYLSLVFDITEDEWLTHDEAQLLLPLEDDTPSE